MRNLKICGEKLCSDSSSGYEHMEEQGIVALISGDNKKKADEEVEDKNDVPQSSKCPFSHGEVMQKMDHYLAYYSYKPEGTPESVPQLVQFCEFSAKKQESTIKQTFIFFLFQQEFRYKLNCLLCNLFL